MATIDSIDAHSLLQSMAPMSYDSSRLIDMACIAFAGLTIEQIEALRKAYNTTVKAEKHQVPRRGSAPACSRLQLGPGPYIRCHALRNKPTCFALSKWWV